MHLLINDLSYSVTEADQRRVVELLQAMLLAEYDKLDDNYQFLSKPIARTILQKMEESARKKGVPKEQALAFRPPKRIDPTKHLLNIVSGIFHEAMKHVQVSITTDDDRVSALSLSLTGQGKSGRSVAFDGHIGEREDDGLKVLGCDIYASLPDHEALCP